MALCLGFAAVCETAAGDDRLALEIPPQPLDVALAALSQAADVQLLYSSALTAGRQSVALSGRYTVEQALSILLADTDLVFARSAEGTLLISRRGEPESIGTVDIAGAPPLRRKGANGSSDVLATEGSGRYTVRGAGVGSPYPQTLKDTPRSISVLGRPQIDDQNLTELGEALRRIPALAVEATAADTVEVSVRGRTLEFYQFDGGPVLRALDGLLSGDLSAYDRIELLNGADGLGNGFVPPSGTLNIVRKRPLDRAQTVISAQAGSWDHFRGMLDVSAAPVADGRLRSRVVIAGVDRDLYFDYGEQQRQSYYGIVEADLLPGTLLRFGGQSVDQRGTPWEGASRPRDSTGAFISPRGTRSSTFVLPWYRQDIRQREVFAAVEQKIAERWTAQLSFDQLGIERTVTSAEYGGDIDPQTGLGGFSVGLKRDNRNDYALADLAVNGRFDWLGHTHILSVGFHHARYGLLERATFADTIYAVDPFNFDPADYPKPGFNDAFAFDTIDARNTRYGGTAALTLHPLEFLKLISAWRWSVWSREDDLAADFGLRARGHARKHGLSYLGATWALDARWNAYASWADAFVPNDSLFTPSGDWPAPTEGNNYETGLKYASTDDRIQGRLTLFRSERSNLPRPVEEQPQDVYCCYVASSDERDRVQGVETEITGTLLPRWALAAGYTYTDLSEHYTPNPLGLADQDLRGVALDPRTSRHALRIWTTWEPRLMALRGLKFGGGARSQSQGLRRVGDYKGQVRQSAYTVVDLMAAWRFHPAWTTALNVRNVFDREYEDSVAFGAFRGEPRSFIISLRGSI
ncbi:MAG TPA: TonB-dependent siderophore receptor [Fontimonas sp.]